MAKQIVDQQNDLFMGSLDVDTLVINIPLEETVEVAQMNFLKESGAFESLSKTECKKLLSLATKDFHFIFDVRLYKQANGVAMYPSRSYIS